MSDLIWLSEAQMRRIEPYFPLSHGVPRVDDRRIISGIIFVIRNGLRWRDAPAGYGPHKTIYNRFIRWSRLGVFNRIFAAAGGQGRQARPVDDRRHPSEGAPHGGQPAQKGAVPRRIGRTKGGLNSKLHAVCDGKGRPLVMLLSEGQMSDYKGAALMLDALPEGQGPARRQGLRRRLVPRRPGRARHRRLHPVKGQPQNPDPARRRALPPAPQDREHVRQAQGLAPHPHPLRPLRPHLHVRHLHRRNRHLLAQSMSPEPSSILI